MSFAFWLYPIGSTSSSVIMGKTAMSAGDNRMYSIFQYSTPDRLHLSWQDETSSSTFLTGGWSDFFSADTWTHCCIVYDGEKVMIYRNGELYTTVNGISNRNNFEYDFPIVGSPIRRLNDVRIYDHTLSPFEVKQISQGLILHYPLNNNGFGQENLYGNGGDCTDLSGLNNYGNKFSVVVEDDQICAHAIGALKNTAYLQSKIPFTPKPNEEMTFSAWVKIKNIVRGTTNPMCGFYFSGQTIDGSWRGATKIKLTVDGIEYSVAQDAWDKAIKDTKWHKIICSAKFGNYEYTSNLLPNIYLRDCTGDLYIHHIKY